MSTKIITAQIIINPNSEKYDIASILEPGVCTTERILVVQDIDKNIVEDVKLPIGKNSLDYCNDSEINGGYFVKFTDDDALYSEVVVKDRTEAAIVLNKLKREAINNLAKILA